MPCRQQSNPVHAGQKSRRDGMLVENHGRDGRESHWDAMLKMMILHAIFYRYAIPPGFLLIADWCSTDISTLREFPSHIRNLKINKIPSGCHVGSNQITSTTVRNPIGMLCR
jgi:hypothetical protein